jgi:hypothetical protein
VPYILNVDYCNITNLKVNVFTKSETLDSQSILSLPPSNTATCIQKMISLPVEKTIETDAKLRVKFVPLEPIEHLIDITDNSVSIEGFPMKLNVFPNRDVFMVSENINGVKLGNLAKFRIYLNEQNDSLNIKITSNSVFNFINSFLNLFIAVFDI